MTTEESYLKIFHICDAIEKCRDQDSLLNLLDNTLTHPAWKRANDFAKSGITDAVLMFCGIVWVPCRDERTFIKEQFDFTRKLYAFSQTDAPILLLGESGTGKTLYAKAIHLLSPRRKKDFKSINCATIPETLLESELFGYEIGSHDKASKQKIGLLEAVNGGTLFLDEIGNASLLTQAKLLTAIEDKIIRRVGGTNETKVDFRIIAATNKDIHGAIKDGEFREDLFHRLKTFVIRIPSLREQLRLWLHASAKMEENSDDIYLRFISIIDSFYKKKYLPKKKASLSDAVRIILTKYAFPGNFRELDQILNYATTVDTDDIIGLDDLPEEVINATSELNNSQMAATVIDDFPVTQCTFQEAQKKDDEFIEHYKRNNSYARKKIISELELADGNVRRVARRLMVSYETLYTQIKRDYGIDVKAIKDDRRKRNAI